MSTTQPPQSNLPPGAELWRRWVEQQIVDTSADTARSLGTLGNSLSGLNGTLTQLGNQVSRIAEQQAFLANATIYSSLPTDPNAWQYDVNPPSVTTVAPAFDPTYDSELTFTAPTTGNYLVNMSSNQIIQIAVNTGWGAVTTHVKFEVTNLSSSETQTYEGLTYGITSGTSAYGGDLYLTLPVSRAFPVPFYGENTYRIRTRRRVATSHSASSGFLHASILTTPFSITRANL